MTPEEVEAIVKAVLLDVASQRYDALMLHYNPHADNAEEIRAAIVSVGTKYGKAVGRQAVSRDDFRHWELV